MSEETAKMNGNGRVTISWHWLAVTLLPITLALAFYIYQMSNTQASVDISTLGSRVTNDEQKISDDHDNIASIKSDVSYIKGLLQQKWGISQNP